MINLLNFFLKHQLKRSKLAQISKGFTLIELLIAIALSSIVIGTLLSFMRNILNSERQEQAKAVTEQETQQAIDYIANDLKQAVYIYDASGLNNSSTDTQPGIKNQIPPIAEAGNCKSTTPTCVPVLVFWKREFRSGILPVTGTAAKNDTFVYSLVAYYLIKGNSSTETWSNTARITRFEIRDGVINPISPTNNDGSPNYITGETPSNGFKAFDLTITGTTLKDKMNRWQKTSGNYTVNALTLVDFIDQNTNGIIPNCPTTTQQVPSTLAGGFYACVDSNTTSAQIYIRGNALARISNNATSASSQSTYFPTASVRVKSRGLLGIQ